MSDAFDLIVVGAGNAGMAATAAGRAAGCTVAVVEEDLLGGTCPNRGCVPKKVLVGVAEVVDHVRRARGHGVTGDAVIDWAQLQAARHAIVDELPARMARSLDSQHVTLIRGSARFTGRHTLAVGDRTLTARKIVIATGSMPRPIGVPGGDRLATSTDVLALAAVPRTAVFVGAGVVAFELAHVLARAGCQRITLLEAAAQPLPRADADAIAALVAYGETLGITVETGVAVTAIDQADHVTVHYTRAGVAHRLTAELAVNGAGRIPQLDRLALDRAGITVEHGRVAHAPDLRLRDHPDVAIVGDAAGDLPQLSPLATSLGTLAANNVIHDGHDAPDLRCVPSCLFTIPTLAQVGVTEAEARVRGLPIKVQRTEGMTGWISSRSHHEELAFAKVLIDTDDHIVGAHLIGHGSDANIHLIALAMRHGIRARELAALDTAYPTAAADLRYLLA
ncbi:MAG TPA: NAD(P)/FAD-dependent oxidoreductase [Kofleriaceae bacterium]|nr:NAD(P)/FAD-dependent oxidoreductase [Kofleriaceae bacterium]